MRLTYLCVLLLLAGCATQQERDERTAQRLISAYGPLCERLGFKRDTPEWGNCLMQQKAANQTCTVVGGFSVCE